MGIPARLVVLGIVFQDTPVETQFNERGESVSDSPLSIDGLASAPLPTPHDIRPMSKRSRRNAKRLIGIGIAIWVMLMFGFLAFAIALDWQP